MYLFLGSDCVAREEDVVGVFDMENSTTGRDTRDFLARAQKAGQVENAAADLPRSFAVLAGGTGQRVCLLQVSAQTVKKRAGQRELFSGAAEKP